MTWFQNWLYCQSATHLTLNAINVDYIDHRRKIKYCLIYRPLIVDCSETILILCLMAHQRPKTCVTKKVKVKFTLKTCVSIAKQCNLF